MISLSDKEAVLPKIVPSSFTVQVDELSSFTISCKADLGDFEFLEWKKRNSTQMLSNTLKRNKHNISTTLSIRHAQLGDAGDYLCYGWTANETKISVIAVSVAGRGNYSSRGRGRKDFWGESMVFRENGGGIGRRELRIKRRHKKVTDN